MKMILQLPSRGGKKEKEKKRKKDAETVVGLLHEKEPADKVQIYLKKVRNEGVVLTASIAIAAVRGICSPMTSQNLQNWEAIES